MGIQLQNRNFFHRKLFKLDITGSIIFSPKYTKTRLAAGLCPYPLGELTALPRPPRWIWGGEGKEGRGKE